MDKIRGISETLYRMYTLLHPLDEPFSLELTHLSTLVQRNVHLEKAFSKEDASEAVDTLVGVKHLA